MIFFQERDVTLATINSASTAESNCSFWAILSSEIFEYDKLIILTPVLMTLCLNLKCIFYNYQLYTHKNQQQQQQKGLMLLSFFHLMIRVHVFSLMNLSLNFSTTSLNLARFPVRTACVNWKYGISALRNCGFLNVALSGISPNSSSTTIENFCTLNKIQKVIAEWVTKTHKYRNWLFAWSRPLHFAAPYAALVSNSSRPLCTQVEWPWCDRSRKSSVPTRC